MGTSSALCQPTDIKDLCEVISQAAAHGGTLAIAGGGSKAAIGAPHDAAVLDMRAFSGVVDYDPPELVLTIRPGTLLSDVQALVATEGQILAFEPFDHGPLLGAAAGRATIGGIIAAGVAGPARLSQGGARDHLLGVHAVSGRGEPFVAGAKVVKNVTGYDLPKLMTGSWGRLAALTELTIKVLPRPKKSLTLLVLGLAPAAASMLLARVMASSLEVAAAAHLPAFGPVAARPVTAFRLQGFEASVGARHAALQAMVAGQGAIDRLDGEASELFWKDIADVAPLAGEATLWRISTPPSGGLSVVNALAVVEPRWLWDWAGGLTWVGFEGDAAVVRSAAAKANGHAMLVRAPIEARCRIPALHPPTPMVGILEERVRRAFDPAGVFETGRF